jgi:8-oxo-dGTP pyrophosphatase MutT (NUDIX family)
LIPVSEILEPIARRLKEIEPFKPIRRDTAGVAVIFKPTSCKEEVLLIKRAEREGDPWSGQVGFPGGRVEAVDVTFRDTAVRETKEEVGIDIEPSARFLGYMGAFNPVNRNIAIVPSIFLLKSDATPRPNAEVSSFRWVRFSDFAGKNRSTHRVVRNGVTVDFPSFNVGDYVVWGLTEKILSTLVGFSQS